MITLTASSCVVPESLRTLVTVIAFCSWHTRALTRNAVTLCAHWSETTVTIPTSSTAIKSIHVRLKKNIGRISSPLEIQMYIQWFLRDFWFTIHWLTLHLSQFRPSTFGWHWQDPKSRSHDTEPHWSHVQAKTTKKNYVKTCKKNSTVFTCTSVGHRMDGVPWQFLRVTASPWYQSSQ